MYTAGLTAPAFGGRNLTMFDHFPDEVQALAAYFVASFQAGEVVRLTRDGRKPPVLVYAGHESAKQARAEGGLAVGFTGPVNPRTAAALTAHFHAALSADDAQVPELQRFLRSASRRRPRVAQALALVPNTARRDRGVVRSFVMAVEICATLEVPSVMEACLCTSWGTLCFVDLGVCRHH